MKQNIPQKICISPTQKNFPGGRASQYIPANGRYYKFSRIDEKGNICYELANVVVGARRRKRPFTPVEECCLETDQDGCLQTDQNGNLQPDQGCN